MNLVRFSAHISSVALPHCDLNAFQDSKKKPGKGRLIVQNNNAIGNCWFSALETNKAQKVLH